MFDLQLATELNNCVINDFLSYVFFRGYQTTESGHSSASSDQYHLQKNSSTNPLTSYSKRMAASKAVREKKAQRSVLQPTASTSRHM